MRKAKAEGNGILLLEGSIVNNHLAIVISDLLRFQIKQAERHGLDSVTITLPRAKEIALGLRQCTKAKPVSRMDQISASLEKAKIAEYRTI
jgi:hypothetical protein